jgi:hypothetical protein
MPGLKSTPRLLHLIFAEFDNTGAWPDRGELQRKIARSGENRHIYAEVRELPPPMGWLEDEKLILSVRGMSHCDLAAPLLEHFLATMRFGE